jgi:hypothetical protein
MTPMKKKNHISHNAAIVFIITTVLTTCAMICCDTHHIDDSLKARKVVEEESINKEREAPLHIDGSPYRIIDAGVADTGERETGNHTKCMVYESVIKEEQQVEVVEEKKTEVLSIDPDTRNKVRGNAGSKKASAHTRPFMIGISGAFAVPVLYEEENFLMPFAGGEVFCAWNVGNLSLFRFSLALSGTYSFHPAGEDMSYKNNMHLLTTSGGVAVFMDVPFDKRWCLLTAFLGGAGLSILESGLYKKTFYITDPSVTLQLGVQYKMSEEISFTGKGQYMMLIDGTDMTDWYHELFLSLGIGMSF